MSTGQDDWTWFARAGSVMVAFSIIDFAMSYSTDKQAELRRYLREHSSPEHLSAKDLEESSHGEIIKLWDESRTTYVTAVVGAVCGTLIWGFGDLVGLLFQSN